MKMFFELKKKQNMIKHIYELQYHLVSQFLIIFFISFLCRKSFHLLPRISKVCSVFFFLLSFCSNIIGDILHWNVACRQPSCTGPSDYYNHSDYGLLLLAEIQCNGKLILFIYQYLFFFNPINLLKSIVIKLGIRHCLFYY